MAGDEGRGLEREDTIQRFWPGIGKRVTERGRSTLFQQVSREQHTRVGNMNYQIVPSMCGPRMDKPDYSPTQLDVTFRRGPGENDSRTPYLLGYFRLVLFLVASDPFLPLPLTLLLQLPTARRMRPHLTGLKRRSTKSMIEMRVRKHHRPRQPSQLPDRPRGRGPLNLITPGVHHQTGPLTDNQPQREIQLSMPPNPDPLTHLDPPRLGHPEILGRTAQRRRDAHLRKGDPH
ncbi:hypothetical protein Aple_066960 [Acrocarpospora pleiomorpha]|uniref:Uncharacterized protein n=1 Tax=Acrocarpospora pleiomorpha TaxID=90975 RepID=A0A5M3XR37_9ACTN|nr:hypothetical protein Aple_066960 [Acrocarpospora pleiomorpha]